MKKQMFVLVLTITVLFFPLVVIAACPNWGNLIFTPPPTGQVGDATQPGGVTVQPGDKQITVSWNQITNVPNYRVYYTDCSGVIFGPEDLSFVDVQNKNTVTITNLENGKTYYLFVVSRQTTNYLTSISAASVVSATPSATGETTTTTTTTTSTTTTTTTTTSTTTTTTTTTTSTTTTTTTLPPLPTCQQMNQMKANAKGFDVNGDGKIDASDAALIIRYLKMNCQ